METLGATDRLLPYFCRLGRTGIANVDRPEMYTSGFWRGEEKKDEERLQTARGTEMA